MGFFKKQFGSADAAASPAADDLSGKKPFSMPIDAVETIPGRGTVVSGIVRLGDNVPICGDGGEPLQSMVVGIEKSRKLLDQAVSGEKVNCLLQGIQPEDVTAGQALIHA